MFKLLQTRSARRAARRRHDAYRQASRRRRTIFEMLEDRRLLAVFSDLESVAPLGSLVVANTESSTFDTASETDIYTIELDGGQTASVLFKPIDTAIQSQLVVRDPNGILLGEIDAAAAGDSIELSSLSIADSGTYQIDATSLAGMGAYELTVALNAVNESEVLGDSQ